MGISRKAIKAQLARQKAMRIFSRSGDSLRWKGGRLFNGNQVVEGTPTIPRRGPVPPGDWMPSTQDVNEAFKRAKANAANRGKKSQEPVVVVETGADRARRRRQEALAAAPSGWGGGRW